MFKVSSYPFPGTVLCDREQFEDYRQSHSNLLDYRYQFEEKLATKSDIMVDGVCPLTLERTTFKSPITDGEKRANGKIVPAWRNHQTCGRGVHMGDRASAHYALYEAPNSSLGSAAYISDSDALPGVITSYCTGLEQKSWGKLGTDTQTYDTILVINGFEVQPDQNKALELLKEHLVPGGRIVFSVNFHYFDIVSVPIKTENGIYWACGWDLLDRLTATGFKAPKAITFWAPELGYLGPYNFIFTAEK
jgi:SAM-dependent methyltransferase